MDFGSCKNQGLNNDIKLAIEDSNIEQVDTFKLLGIFIDSKLTFKSHINQIPYKVNAHLAIIFNIK